MRADKLRMKDDAPPSPSLPLKRGESRKRNAGPKVPSPFLRGRLGWGVRGQAGAVGTVHNVKEQALRAIFSS